MRAWIHTLSVLLVAGTLHAQTTPTGSLSGRVVDDQNLALPGVAVSATSTGLQGARGTVTSSNGDFILPFLPPGEYELRFELGGFATLERTEVVRTGETTHVSARLRIQSLAESVTVQATPSSDFGTGAQVSTRYQSDFVERLPLDRSVVGAAQLAPGVQASGPGGNVMVNGAMSFESLYVVDGVVVNENLRGQAMTLFVEDALQETTIKTGSVSAEYGRFQGGVVEALTKSGGNELHGSYRLTVDNDDWTALTPYKNDSRTDKLLPTHEATLGGPFVKDKLWFFGAARLARRETSNATSITAVSFPVVRDQKRYEGKLSLALDPRHTLKGAYTRIEDSEEGNFFPPIMDTASLVNRETPQDLLSANYTGILSPQFFVEGQYSRRRFSFVGSGSRFTDPVKGTLMLDQSRGNARFWSPTFCGVCDDEERDNQNLIAKGSYFVSTRSLGSHHLVAGVDVFDDKRFSNNHQSGSDYRVFATSAIVQGQDIFPVFDSRTIIQWNPIPVSSKGNRFRTVSAFFNDVWTLDRRFTFNLGVRYDKNDGIDQSGATVVKDAAFSPRLSASFDPRGDGNFTVNAAFGRYVAGISNAAGGSASSAGNPASYQYDYLGPQVNAGNPASPLRTDQALEVLWAWFDANGGTDRATRGAPVVPGLNTRMSETLVSPNSLEYVLGFTRRFGTRASLRVDGVYRSYGDFYATRVDRGTGQVTDPFGRRFDVRVQQNTDDVERSYKGLNAQAQLRAGSRVNLGANYTLGSLRGNFEGENGPSGPQPAAIVTYPEYFDPAWGFPVGGMLGDVRHKARGWLIWDSPVPGALGRLSLAALQFFGSGTPYGAVGPVDTRPFVANPGYATPPASVNYFFTARDAYRTRSMLRSDLALNWSRRIGVKNAELFFRGTVLNVFNRQELTNFFDTCGTGGCINTTVLTNANTASLARFDPFTQTPVEGVHWRKGPAFGQALSRFAYQTPRTFQFSAGVRF
ncbi:MAG: carboxypeptidase regulatory-like domain-containing protein [Vicinamibacteria bacterium]